MLVNQQPWQMRQWQLAQQQLEEENKQLTDAIELQKKQFMTPETPKAKNQPPDLQDSRKKQIESDRG